MKKTVKKPATLDKIRREIDSVDDQILRLLSKRFQLTRRMGIFKYRTGASIIDTGREKQIFERLLHKINGSILDPRLVLGIWRNIIKRSYQIQRQVLNGKKDQGN